MSRAVRVDFSNVPSLFLVRSDVTDGGAGVRTISPGKFNLRTRPPLSLYFGI